MSVLSLTFHCPENRLPEWEKYVDETLTVLTENLIDADHYILSEVHTEMLSEGKNFNLLLIFANEELRNGFMESELENIAERIAEKFGNDVMLFPTLLNPIKTRI